MQLTSIPFLIYFLPILLIIYYAASFSAMAQNGVLFVACLLFYSWGDPQSIMLLVACILLSSVASYLIKRMEGQMKKIMLYIGVGVNLFILFATRYMGTFLELLGPSLGVELHYSVHEPMGMLVYILHAISYLVDVYRGKAEVDSPFNVGIYIAFFPFLSHGPLICYRDIQPQLRNRKIDYRLLALGACRLVVGLAKLVILSDRLSGVATNIFNLATIDSGEYSVPILLSWLGVGTFTLQIYFEFSGFADMAIGVAMLLGYRINENFNAPYSATSVREFWRRWEIGLVQWSQRYINSLFSETHSEGEDASVFQIFTFALMGFWHGTSYTFLLWGVFNGIIVLAESIVDYPSKIPTKFLKHVYTMFLVCLGMVMFRAGDSYQASRYYLDLFGLNNNGFFSDIALRMIRENWIYYIAGILFCTPIARNMNGRMFKDQNGLLNQVMTVVYPVCMCLLLGICICFIVVGNYFPTL